MLSGDVVSPRSAPICSQFIFCGSALLEADFTTERAQHDFRCCLTDRAKEGTSLFHGKTGVLGLEFKVVLDTAQHRVRAEISRDLGGRQGLDIPGVGGEPIVASGAEITVVENLSAAGICLHQRSTDRLQVDVATD